MLLREIYSPPQDRKKANERKKCSHHSQLQTGDYVCVYQALHVTNQISPSEVTMGNRVGNYMRN